LTLLLLKYLFIFASVLYPIQVLPKLPAVKYPNASWLCNEIGIDDAE